MTLANEESIQQIWLKSVQKCLKKAKNEQMVQEKNGEKNGVDTNISVFSLEIHMNDDRNIFLSEALFFCFSFLESTTSRI